jgi:hypothetical protein
VERFLNIDGTMYRFWNTATAKSVFLLMVNSFAVVGIKYNKYEEIS